jgi:integrase
VRRARIRHGRCVLGACIWNTIVSDKTKTKASKAPVPVVPMLRDLLEAHRNGFPADGFIFAGEKLGRPLNLSNLARRVIAPTLKTSGVEWAGWHGFRRALATNLYAVGAPENMIQDILRHADLKVTRQFYIKPQTAQTAKPALKKLTAAFQVARKNARKAVSHNRITTA